VESVLSIDLGTTTLKAGVVDASGAQHSLVRRELSLVRPEPGAAEHDPHALVEALLETSTRAVAQSGLRPSRVVLCGYQFGLLLADREGRPLTGMTTLLDTRAKAVFGRFSAENPPGPLYQRTGCPAFFLYPSVRCRFFREERPELWKRVGQFHSSKSWLVQALCGVSLSDVCTDSATQLLNLHTRSWDPELLASAGLDPAWMPALGEACGASAEVLPAGVARLGLAPGARMLAGTYDGAAIGLGLGVTSPGDGVLNLGTSGMVRVVTDRAVLDDPAQMRFQSVCYPGGTYFAGGGINNAAVVMRWFRDELGGTPFDQMDGLARQSPGGARGLIYLPYLTGERDWRDGHALSSTLFGMRESHVKADVLRAFMEGVSHCFGSLVRDMRECGLPVTSVRAAGGGVRGSELWQEILAESLGCPMILGASDEAALTGNAALGLADLGVFPDLATAAKALAQEGRRVDPRSEGIRAAGVRLEQWRALTRALLPIYHAHASQG
jgi:gluconokinase